MLQAYAVIGANYGDEGKGLITDYLTRQAPGRVLVVRCNGGAQAGHTVTTRGGRHVFHHIGAGTLAGGDTYLSQFFIVNPILFEQEHAAIPCAAPKVYYHTMALVTTPYDMLINQAMERKRGGTRHGSCGVGINETVERSKCGFALYAGTLSSPGFLLKELERMNEWWPARMAALGLEFEDLQVDHDQLETIQTHFINACDLFASVCRPIDYAHSLKDTTIIFEGAQGLGLDEVHGAFPHVTRSRTGFDNIGVVAAGLGVKNIETHYVTRAYLTRHGAGPLPNEYAAGPPAGVVDTTNVDHKWQGMLRTAPLEIAQLRARIAADRATARRFKGTVTAKLDITCLDQCGEYTLASNSIFSTQSPAHTARLIRYATNLPHGLHAAGPRAEDVKAV